VTSMPPFRDRSIAGGVLAESLARYASVSGVVVLGLARGGVPVARRVADVLDATLGVLVARRLVVPGVEDVALGAIVEGSRRIVLSVAAQHLGVPARLLERLATRERVDLERFASLYHAGWPLPDLRGRVVLLVDDGLATGGTLRAAAHVVRRAHPARLIAAVPVASRWGLERVAPAVDDLAVVCVPTNFETIAGAYQDYAPVSDDEVLSLLGRRRLRVASAVRDIGDRLGIASSWTDGQFRDRERTISIPVAGGTVRADAGMPPRAIYESAMQRTDHVRGLAVLAHGAGTDRSGFASRYLAGRLRLGGYATLRLDLSTTSEQLAGNGFRFMFDLPSLVKRFADVCDWVAREGAAGAQRMILVGARAAAAAALAVAGRRPGHVRGVIVRGVRVDLAADAVSQVRAAVLVIAGADEAAVRQRDALLSQVRGSAEVVKVPHAARALDEPSAVGFIAERIVGWLDGLDRWDRKSARRPSRS